MKPELRPEELKVGALYRLTEDVPNPVLDKRLADHMRKTEVFEKGTTFVCLCDDEFPALRRLHLTRHSIVGHNTDESFTAAIVREGGVELSKHPNDQNWTAVIVPCLEEIPIDSWKRMETAYGWNAMTTVLRELVKDGTVPLERVAELMREHTHGAKLP